MKIKTRFNIYKIVFSIALIFLIASATIAEMLYFIEGCAAIYLIRLFNECDEFVSGEEQ